MIRPIAIAGCLLLLGCASAPPAPYPKPAPTSSDYTTPRRARGPDFYMLGELVGAASRPSECEHG